MKDFPSINHKIIHMALIVIMVLAVYGHTLSAPFVWDEGHFLINNPLATDLSYHTKVLDTEDYDALGPFAQFTNRRVGFLTFALNYNIHGLDVRGYHAFNIVVHILNSLLVYLLVLTTMKTPWMHDAKSKLPSGGIALFAALVFAVHPMGTEAVTYIFQRLASLVALFYLGAMFFYARSRLSKSSGMSVGYYICAIICALLAMKTKENAFTLPIAILMYEFLFLRGTLKERAICLSPILLMLSIVPLGVMSFGPQNINTVPVSYADYGRGEYFVTQLSVILTYLRLLSLPIGQNLDHDQPVLHSVFEPEAAGAGLLLLFIVASACIAILRPYKGIKSLRIVGFGILWFFLTLSVESSIVPLQMLIDEYRAYLPSVGIFIAVAMIGGELYSRLERRSLKKVVTVIAIMLIIVLSVASHTRNTLWLKKSTIWDDVVKKSPHKLRGYINLGNAYVDEERFDEAMRTYNTATELKADTPTEVATMAEVHYNMAHLYANLNLLDMAIKHYKITITLVSNNADAYNNLGVIYYQNRQYGKAIQMYKQAIATDASLSSAYYNLGEAYQDTAVLKKAKIHYEQFLALEPGFHMALDNLEDVNKELEKLKK